MSRLRRSRPKPGDKERILAIRQAMLRDLIEVSESHKLTPVYVRIVFAPDIQSLWYLRCDMMALIAMEVGESAARKSVAATTKMFSGLMPAPRKSRLSQLHH